MLLFFSVWRVTNVVNIVITVFLKWPSNDFLPRVVESYWKNKHLKQCYPRLSYCWGMILPGGLVVIHTIVFDELPLNLPAVKVFRLPGRSCSKFSAIITEPDATSQVKTLHLFLGGRTSFADSFKKKFCRWSKKSLLHLSNMFFTNHLPRKTNFKKSWLFFWSCIKKEKRFYCRWFFLSFWFAWSFFLKQEKILRKLQTKKKSVVIYGKNDFTWVQRKVK